MKSKRELSIGKQLVPVLPEVFRGTKGARDADFLGNVKRAERYHCPRDGLTKGWEDIF